MSTNVQPKGTSKALAVSSHGLKYNVFIGTRVKRRPIKFHAQANFAIGTVSGRVKPLARRAGVKKSKGSEKHTKASHNLHVSWQGSVHRRPRKFHA